MLMLMPHCGSLVAYAYACVASEDQALHSLSQGNTQFWAQFNKEIQEYLTSRTLVFTNSHQFESTKSLYKVPLEASDLYLQWYSIRFNQL